MNTEDEILAHLATADLQAFSVALESGWIAHSSPEKLFKTYAGDNASDLRAWLRSLSPAVFNPAQVARLVRAVISGRAREYQLAPDLVVSGPDVPGIPTADTYAVVQSLFEQASSEIILAGYAFYNGAALFERLHSHWVSNPKLRVIFHVDVPRRLGNTSSAEGIIAAWVDEFRTKHWPWQPAPELYFDPRALESDSKSRASLHAKVVVIDRKKLLLTSANFTEAAQQKNIELGVLCALPHLAERICGYFEALRNRGDLRRLPFD